MGFVHLTTQPTFTQHTHYDAYSHNVARLSILHKHQLTSRLVDAVGKAVSMVRSLAN